MKENTLAAWADIIKNVPSRKDSKEEVSMTLVLETEGKGDSVDYARVLIFQSKEEAEEYVSGVPQIKEKYWKKAEIIAPGAKVELSSPYHY